MSKLDRQWRKTRLVVLDRDGYRCHWCGGHANQVDHLLERCHGGLNSLDNLVASCAGCNARRGGVIGARRSRSASSTHPFFLPEAR